jgi:sigma-B regulation protein RsbU (phosphoserine phosphatase)
MDETHQQRILIVDDAPENIDILTSTLSEYKKSIAMTGEKALKIAMTDNPPDLILLDIVMPGMDGYEVCRRLKAVDRTRDIPVIFLTGEKDSESVVKAFNLGAVDYVTKPFNIPELLARVNTQMALKRSKDFIARYVKDIENKNRQITDSINYASRIQNAILPTEKDLSEILNDYFILFRPKNIVSGDFYWARKIDHKIIVIAADCTGHGVPGAFMSMFGVAFLNEIIGKENISIPAVILSRLRDMIVQSLRQDSGSENKDGMEMAVVSIDYNKKIIHFAGTQNSLYMVRDKKLIETKCDKIPLSIHPKIYNFTNQTIEIKKNDQIYIFSDGYADQFGGPDNRKFMYRSFKQLLLETSDKPMKEQKKILEERFDDWKGDQDQTDDVILIGIKI